MTTLYLIRHAEAEGNLYRRAQGQFDANITMLGRRQVAALAERFRDVRLDALWSSDLHRTMSTAQAIVKYHPDLPLQTDPRLREIDVGPWEDCHWGNLGRDFPEQMDFFSNHPDKWNIPGGEPFAAVQDRMMQALRELARRYDGGTIAVFSHGAAIKTVLAYVSGLPLSRMAEIPYGDNTAVTVLQADGDAFRLVSMNDSSHLKNLSTFARQEFRPAALPSDKRFSVLDPLDLQKDGALFEHCYSSTWQCAHGSLDGYVPAVYLACAREHAMHDPNMVMSLRDAGKFAGVIDLDPEHGSDIGCGWISLLYVEPEFRGRRMGIQLIGHAVSVFRKAGRSALRLSVADSNKNAIGFYRHYGFRIIDTVAGANGPLHRMEMDITKRIILPDR